MSGKSSYLPRVRLYSDNQRDREILEWLQELASGFKGDNIKDAIWASIKGLPPRKAPKIYTPPPTYQTSPPTTPVPNGTISGSVTFDTRELLADIRQIVEVGVAQGLTRHGAITPSVSQPGDANEIESLLDDLDMSFMLDDDDDDN